MQKIRWLVHQLTTLLWFSLLCTTLPTQSEPIPDFDTTAEISINGAMRPVTDVELEPDATSHTPWFQQLHSIRSILRSVTASPDIGYVEQEQNKNSIPPIVGIPVVVPELAMNSAVQDNFLHVNAHNGGILLGISIQAPTAAGMRLGLLIENIPITATVAFFAANADTPVAPPVTGAQIKSLLDLNLAAGDSSNNGRTYWSPVITGEESVLLIHVPAGIDSTEVRFSIPQISFLFQEPLTAKTAGTCNIDTTCYANWNNSASGVAAMVFTSEGDTFICSGFLLNTINESFIPYFLTANHCISTQTEASTLETYWFHQSKNCNSSTRDSRYTAITSGAKLLYNSAATDTSFMQLNNDPPGASYFLGWTIDDPVSGATLTNINHPSENWDYVPPHAMKKISFGTFHSYLNCTNDDENGDFSCSAATSSTGKFIKEILSSGMVESGSSGSPLFNSDGRVIGQVRGGNASCSSNPNGRVVYGRFDIAYLGTIDPPGLKYWVGPQQPPPDPIVTPTWTPSDGGVVNPNTPQSVIAGATTSFTVTPNSGYAYNNVVDGTCPQGSWSGNKWTTGAITADCTVSFSFGINPPVATTKLPTNITATSATLNGTVNANGAATTVCFDFGTTTNYGTCVPATPSSVTGNNNTAVSANKTGLTCNTTYHYRVKAVNSAGTSYGADASLKTLACPLTVTPTWSPNEGGAVTPNTPQTVRNNGATVNFTVIPNNNYTRNSAVGGNCPQGSWNGNVWTTGAITASCTVNFNFSPGGACGSANGGIFTEEPTTGLCDSGTASTVTNTTDQWLWSCSGSNGGTTANCSANKPGYVIYASAGANGTIDPTLLIVSHGATGKFTAFPNSNYVKDPVVGGTCPQGSWSGNVWTTGSIIAANNGCTASFSFKPGISPPVATTNLSTNVTATSAILNGSVISNGGVATVTFDFGTTTAYSTSIAATPNQVLSNTAVVVSANRTGLVCDTTYHYRTKAINSAGTDYGTDVSFKTLACPPPTAVTNPVSNITKTSTTLNGTVNANGTPTTVSFDFGTSTVYDTSVAPTPGNVTGNTNTAVSANKTGLTCGKTYHYRTKAVNSAGTDYGEDEIFTTAACFINGVCGTANGSTFNIAPTANLCSVGTASAVTGTGPWNWTCAGSNGGTTANCSANINYAVTPIAGANGSVTPNTPQLVNPGALKSFTVTPNIGYIKDFIVGDNCPQGSWNEGSRWTTGPITANCTVKFNFIEQPTAWFSPTNPYTTVSDKLTLDLRVDSFGSPINNYNFNVIFDPTKLRADLTFQDELKTCKSGVCNGANALSSMNAIVDQVTGTITLTGFEDLGVGPSNNLELVKIHFLTMPNTATTLVNLTLVNLLTNGVSHNIGNGLTSNALVTIQRYKCGDANGDTSVNIVDALAIARQIIGLPPPPSITPVADVNQNGEISITDALHIARYSVGFVVMGTCLM